MKRSSSALLIVALLMAVAAIAFSPPAKSESAQIAVIKTSAPAPLVQTASAESATAPMYKKEKSTHPIGVMMATNAQEFREVTTRARNGSNNPKAEPGLRNIDGAPEPPDTEYVLRC